MQRRWFCVLSPFLVAPFAAGEIHAQVLPLSPTRESGQTITPAFEGWYKNPDGSFSLSFGYFNRNEREVVEVPVGPNNFFAPGDSNSGQPTRFEPQRHWGVFAIKVPADFGDKQLVWTLTFRGHTYNIPGSLKRGWEIDALYVATGAGNRPPVIRFDEQPGPGAIEARGPGGAFANAMTAVVGTPLALTVWANDEPVAGATAPAGRAATAGRAGSAGGGGGAAVALAWFKHQGPGDVTFNPVAPRPDRAAGGRASTMATFSAPGVYILRVRATEGSVASAGHAQCCWTNGFVKVTVSR
jgi:hypothetical protein